jgi:HEAT repeat protein
VSDLEGKTNDCGQKIAEDELKLVKAVIQGFLQALKASHLYEADHPILLRFLDRLKQDFDSYFEKYDAFIIQVDELHFFFDGKAIYEGGNIRESLAFLFFKDGIREIRFFKGLDFNEVLDFLTIVRKSNFVDRMADDLVTLLWNKDFSHIEFIVIDEFFEGGGILIPLSEEDLIKGLEYRGFEEVGTGQDDTSVGIVNGAGSEAGLGNGIEFGAGHGKGIEVGVGTGSETGAGIGFGNGTGAGGGLRRGTGSGVGAGIDLGKGVGTELRSGPVIGDLPSLAVESLRQALNLSTEKSLAQICALTPDEIEEIYRRAHKEEQLETLYALMNNFTEILLHLGEDTKTYENIVSYFDRIVKSLLEEGEVRKAVTILRNFHDVMVKVPLKEKQSHAIEHILQIASDSRSIELLGKVMQRNNEADRGHITQYLQLVTQNAIDPLCFLLGGLDADRWRKAVRERLVELCKEEIKPLVKFLSDSRTSFIFDLLYIFGKVKHPSTLKYLTNLAYHENAKVREEILSLATVFGEKEQDLLLKFLWDSVPEIRGKAALIFARIAKDQAVKPLVEIILSEDFYTRSYDEKVSFFKALAETKSQKAIPILEQIIKKKRWSKKAQWEEVRTCAVNALKMIGADKE